MCAIRKKRMTLGQLVYINNRVLIPRLECRLQCCILPENKCMNLHRPMLMMIKNKANLAKTLATSTITHKNIIRVRTLWQNQISHHFTELTIRLNDDSELGQTMWIRLMQSQLRCKSTKSMLEVEYTRLARHNIRNNLTFNIIKLAKRFGLEIRDCKNTKILNFVQQDTELVELLKKQSLTSYCNKNKLHIYTVGQLLNPSGNKMITWQQAKKIRGQGCSGKKATWFSQLEQELIAEALETREIKDKYKKAGTNCQFCKAELRNISYDKRRKDWIIFSTKSIQEDYEFARILKKNENKTMLLQHWVRSEEPGRQGYRLKECQGCELTEGKKERKCILTKAFKSNKRAIDKRLLQKSKENDGTQYELVCDIAHLVPFEKAILSTDRKLEEQPIPMVIVKLYEEELIED